MGISMQIEKQNQKTAFVKLKSLQIKGLEPSEVAIEAFRSRGLAQFFLTGLPDAWLRDSREKIKALLWEFGQWSAVDKLLVHLLPVEAAKNGAHLELPIVLASLLALSREQIPKSTAQNIEKYFFVGSLGLCGNILATPQTSLFEQYSPSQCIGPSTYKTLGELWSDIICGELKLPKNNSELSNKRTYSRIESTTQGRLTERFLLMAASLQKTHVLMMGSPGIGKSHLAKWAHRLCLSPHSKNRFIIEQIWKLSGQELSYDAPLVQPHSRSNLHEFIGTSKNGLQRPGLWSLAHGGLLILDEFSELNRDSRETLRTILDQKCVLNSQKGENISWPADYWMIGTSNPCFCGWAKTDYGRCRCSMSQRANYNAKLSGPILDRMGLKLFLKSQELHLPDDLKKNFSFELFNAPEEELQQFLSKAKNDLHLYQEKSKTLVHNDLGFQNISIRQQQHFVNLFSSIKALCPKLSDAFILSMLVHIKKEEELICSI